MGGVRAVQRPRMMTDQVFIERRFAFRLVLILLKAHICLNSYSLDFRGVEI